MKGRLGAFVLGVVAVVAGSVSAPALLSPLSPSVASAQSACGPASQPCTWNFSPLGANGGGADVSAAQAEGREGAGVLVAVVDTWVDPTHPAFGGRVVDEADCVGAGASGTPDPRACHDHQYAQDSCDHGTHVAGTVASSNYGVAPRANILAVQTMTPDSSGDCSGDATDVAAGVLFAAQHGARVINLSVGDLLPGFTQDSNLTDAVHQAAALGAVVIFAAGNNGAPITDNYGNDALLVAATGPSGQLAGYSNAGGGVNLAAPGGDDGTTCIGACLVGGAGCAANNCILSTVPGGYALMEGTSMAAPHVSGTAALLFGENPSRGRADVIHALEATAHPLGGAGSGLIDAAAALALEPAGAPAGSGPPRAAPQPVSTGGQRASAAGASRATPPFGGAPAGSVGSAVQSSSTIAAPTTSTSASSVPQTSWNLPSGSRLPAHRSAAAASHAGTSGSEVSVAAAGAVAALLLLMTVVGTGALALRRRTQVGGSRRSHLGRRT